ncbi:oxidoreductase [Sphingomonas hengshuiensis]|uniref:Short-chain dehydrogenase n=1 Tax=Sphingomonas hengshuiensis TaxID=1609977 RepID=A0A7U5BFF4_9SPHN|nr:oxidoreductase [Sphingomonas hengshuiensis]AJP74276.1 short-chain dehydrogenase [Sphingomonas hengshuiensis]
MTTWLITGVSSGLGKALAAAALARGDMVIGTARRDADLVAFESQAPGRALGIQLDLAVPGSAAAAVARAEAMVPQIDRLVNNAGYGMVGAIEETAIDQARALFDVNVFGPMAMIQAVLPAMRARRAGHIVNITSLSGFAPWWGTGIYGASKYAFECIGQTLAQELQPLGIAVTNVAPGGFRTGFAGTALVEAERHIPDYDDGARQSKLSLLAGRGNEHGDPAKAAQAILAALDEPAPPRHLFLGEDALRHAREHFEMLEGEMQRWEALSLSTAYAL